MPFFQFGYHDSQLTKMNKEKNYASSRSINLGYRNGGTRYVWVQIKRRRTYKQI